MDNEFKEVYYRLIEAARQRRLKFKEQEYIGKKYQISIENNEIEFFLHEPKLFDRSNKYPLVINIHGGAFIAGDARSMETWCRDIAIELDCFVANINYTKIDVKKLPYPSNEVVNVIEYLLEQSLCIDKTRISVMGFSAGANIAASTLLRTLETDYYLKSQILVYPCVDVTFPKSSDSGVRDFVKFMMGDQDLTSPLISPMYADYSNINDFPETIIIVAGKDDLGYQGQDYSNLLKQNGVNVIFKIYENALHGFIELNLPEHTKNKVGQDKTQFDLMLEAKEFIIESLRISFDGYTYE